MGSITLHKVFKKIGVERGQDNEDRFFEVFKYGRVPPGFPRWFCGLRRATQEEDCGGIDAVAFTEDVGNIFLQIKSSRCGVEKFKKQQKKYRKRKWIFPVIIRTNDGDAEIAEKTRYVLSQARQAILSLRKSFHLT